MLSTGAFNALLKTIEEPPSYVIFILATTEVHKIPVTILSRCQRYDFKRITIDTITARLEELMKEESIEVEEKALRYVARAADGSLRDALSLLDQCISFYLGKRITYDNVLEVLGAVDTAVFSQLLNNIRKQEVTACIQLLEDIESGGRELGQFTIDFIWYLRNLLLMKTTEDVSEIITEISTENLQLLKQEAGTVDEQSLMRYIRIFSELSSQIRYAARKRVLIEIALIKLCKPEMEQNYDSLLDRIKQIEEKLESGIVVNSAGNQDSVPNAKPKQEKKPVVLPEALPEDIKEAANNWKGIVAQITRKAPALGSVLNGSTLSIDGGQGLLIVVTNELDKDLIDREAHLQIIKDTIAQMLRKQVVVNTKYLDKAKERLEDVPDLTKLIKVPIQYE
jgi:DNA polymerase-3 subunit gamma/tau